MAIVLGIHPANKMTTRAIWTEDINRALVMVGMPGGGLSPNPQREAAVAVWDAWQRNQFAEDNPSYLPATTFEAALAEFVALCPPPAADVHDYSLSQNDTTSWQALRAPVQAVSVSYAVTHFAQKAQISLEEAEAVLAHVKPTDGHRSNALRAQKTIAKFAKKHEITVAAAIVVMREWAEGRE